MVAVMKQAAGTEEVDTEFEVEFFRAKQMLEEAFFDFESWNTRQFLDKIQEIFALAQLKESDTELAIKVLISTRARFQREIRSEIMSAVAEKVAMLWTK